MNHTRTKWPFTDMAALASEAECWETPDWAAHAILRTELLTSSVVDPCCGRGVLSIAAKEAGYSVRSQDLHDWGYGDTGIDFLDMRPGSMDLSESTIFMNPPFSKAEDFVRQSFALGARKIVCFQRFAWWESVKRKPFWHEFTPHRIYVCGNRATCWLVSIPPEKRTSGTTTAHAWFVWEAGHPNGTLTGHIYKKTDK